MREQIIFECTEARAEGKPPSRYFGTKNKKLQKDRIELKKFNKQESDLKSIIEKWIFFIKNAGNLEMIPKSAEEIPELREAYRQAEMNAWSKKELEVYEYWQIRDAADRYGLEAEHSKGKIEVALEKL